MGQRKLGRDVRSGWRDDPLRAYLKHYKLIAHCRRPGCGHARDLPIGLLMRVFTLETTIGQMALRFRCSKCHMRGARIEAEYVGPSGYER